LAATWRPFYRHSGSRPAQGTRGDERLACLPRPGSKEAIFRRLSCRQEHLHVLWPATPNTGSLLRRWSSSRRRRQTLPSRKLLCRPSSLCTRYGRLEHRLQDPPSFLDSHAPYRWQSHRGDIGAVSGRRARHFGVQSTVRSFQPNFAICRRLLNRVRDILTRCNETWNRIPSHLQYRHSCWNDGTPSGTCLMLLVVYLEYLQNEFQLQRLLCRQQRCASDALLNISMRMLTAAIILPGIQIDSVNIHRDRAWIVSSLPRTFLPMSLTGIALVLCVPERWRPCHRPSHAHTAGF
jgi:hypothetical protein